MLSGKPKNFDERRNSVENKLIPNLLELCREFNVNVVYGHPMITVKPEPIVKKSEDGGKDEVIAKPEIQKRDANSLHIEFRKTQEDLRRDEAAKFRETVASDLSEENL